MSPLTPDFWFGIAIAVFCGTVLGLERQLRGKPAGIRTSILICLSTMIFIHVGGLAAGPEGDPTRVLGQVVTGVGFLGAGVILARDGLIHGVTSAAVIWILAAVGAMVGFRQYTAAVAVTLLVVVILVGVSGLESAFRRLRTGVHADEGQRSKRTHS